MDTINGIDVVLFVWAFGASALATYLYSLLERQQTSRDYYTDNTTEVYDHEKDGL